MGYSCSSRLLVKVGFKVFNWIVGPGPQQTKSIIHAPGVPRIEQTLHNTTENVRGQALRLPTLYPGNSPFASFTAERAAKFTRDLSVLLVPHWLIFICKHHQLTSGGLFDYFLVSIYRRKFRAHTNRSKVRLGSHSSHNSGLLWFRYFNC